MWCSISLVRLLQVYARCMIHQETTLVDHTIWRQRIPSLCTDVTLVSYAHVYPSGSFWSPKPLSVSFVLHERKQAMSYDDTNLQAHGFAGQRADTAQSRRRIGWRVLVAGDVLVLVAFFVPWARLYTTFPNVAGTREYSPFAFAWESLSQGALLPSMLVALPVVIILASTIVLITWSLSTRQREVLASVSALLSFSSVLVSLLVVLFLTPILGAYWPYYSTTIELGGWVAIGGFFIVAIGSTLSGS